MKEQQNACQSHQNLSNKKVFLVLCVFRLEQAQTEHPTEITKETTTMPISNGDQMPEGSLKAMTESGIKDMSTADLFNGRKVTLFSVPVAFTPT